MRQPHASDSKFPDHLNDHIEDSRKDRIWRFVTLIFMLQDHEVSLTQYGSDILVERVTE